MVEPTPLRNWSGRRYWRTSGAPRKSPNWGIGVWRQRFRRSSKRLKVGVEVRFTQVQERFEIGGFVSREGMFGNGANAKRFEESLDVILQGRSLRVDTPTMIPAVVRTGL